MDTFLVFAGGPSPTPRERATIMGRMSATTARRAVAADSGLELADAVGATVDAVVGDMDSVDAARLRRAESDGAAIVRFPADKDATDLELALAEVASTAAPGDRIVLIGTTAGRFDHVLAAVLGLAGPELAPFVCDAWLGTDVVHVVRGARSLAMEPGATFSILPVHGPATVTESGVQWPLDERTLQPGSSLGVSNVAAGERVDIEVTGGVALVVVADPAFDDESGPRR